MRLRSHRRSITGWNPPAGFAAGREYSLLARSRRNRRVRWWIRTGTLLSVIGLMRVARAMRANWWRWLAGAVLTTAGVVLRHNLDSGLFLLLPGVMFLLSAVLAPAPAKGSNPRLEMLERELARYVTAAQRADLEATLNRYPDRDTHELRDILARSR